MVTGKRKDPPEGYLIPWSHTTSSLCPVFAVSGSSLSSGVMEELTLSFYTLAPGLIRDSKQSDHVQWLWFLSLSSEQALQIPPVCFSSWAI